MSHARRNHSQTTAQVGGAETADLEAKLGAVLLPTLTNLITTLNDIIGPAGDVFNALGKLRDFGPIDVPINIGVQLTFAGRGTVGTGHSSASSNRKLKMRSRQVSQQAWGRLRAWKTSFAVAPAGQDSGSSQHPSIPGAVAGPIRRGRKQRRRTLQQPLLRKLRDSSQAQAIVDKILRQNAGQKSLNQQMADSEARAAHLEISSSKTPATSSSSNDSPPN